MSKANEKCLERVRGYINFAYNIIECYIAFIRYPFETIFISREIKNPEGERI